MEDRAGESRPPKAPSPASARKAAVTFTHPPPQPFLVKTATLQRYNLGVALAVASVLVGLLVICMRMDSGYRIWNVVGGFASSLCAILLWDVVLSNAVNRE